MALAAAEKTSARTRRNPKAVEAAIGALAAKFGNRLVTSLAVREQHGNILTWIENQPPDAVVFPQSSADVQDAVRICVQHKVPVIPFGTGTSLEGHINAPQGGVTLDFRDMNRVLAVHAEDLDCVVEPGVTRKQLNEFLRDQGLFFPIDPGADASIGGMSATRASGTNAVRYGTMKDNVLALKVVLASGEIIATARRAKKSAAGYDLTRLFVGSEGTLGVITEITVKLHGIPEAISGGICPFPSVDAACNAAIATIQSGIPVARIELLDEVQVRACNAYSKLTLPESADAVPRISRDDGGRCRAIRTFRRNCRRPWRRSVHLDHQYRGTHQALAGAARRLLGGARPAAGRAAVRDRRLRPALKACRMRRRDPARYRVARPDRADRRPCRATATSIAPR